MNLDSIYFFGAIAWWVMGSIFSAVCAIGKKEISFLEVLLASIICSPFIGFLIVITCKDKQTDELEQELLKYLKSKK